MGGPLPRERLPNNPMRTKPTHWRKTAYQHCLAQAATTPLVFGEGKNTRAWAVLAKVGKTHRTDTAVDEHLAHYRHDEEAPVVPAQELDAREAEEGGHAHQAAGALPVYHADLLDYLGEQAELQDCQDNASYS